MKKVKKMKKKNEKINKKIIVTIKKNSSGKEGNL
jgi:hypothetical protein